MSLGLSSEDARRLLAESGPNELRRAEATSPWRILARQFASPMIALLAGAATLAAALGEISDAVAIGTIVVLNGLVGFFQEYRAEKAVLALRAMTAPRARVMRDGKPAMIAAIEVVPGDVLLLEAGDVVAADARLVEAHSLSAQEAALTGESAPVEKSVRAVAAGVPLAERTDCVFAGTAIANGSGSARVEATGMRTELGHIAHLLATAEESATPLQKRLEQVSRSLLLLCLGVVAVVAVLGLVQGQGWMEVLLGAVSLAVAAVPEGLPAVVTIALALGVQRMAARHVLVRKLPAVETLGAATVICTDKTGTLTTGQMTVREVWGPDMDEVVRVAAANCDAVPPVGDPTEVAIVLAARARGIEVDEAKNPRVKTNPFDSERKRMSILRSDGVLYVKGAADGLVPICVQVPEGAERAIAEMASRGLRVLGVALGAGPEEKELRLVGLLGIADPPRTEAIRAVADARAAGITTVMITGDHPATARAIAREMGILLADEDASGRVHARVAPEEKLQIVREWKRRGAIVAMTGDGVNDAPALREAHIGIAMGKGGTEVTREAADMVLADDNFASIVEAVREGRAIYDNIRKTLVYLLSGNAGELMLMFGAAVLGMPVPLLPLHLLWINLVTDGMPALALVVDPPEQDVLKRPPRPVDEPMLGRPEWARVILTGLVEASVVLAVFAFTLEREGEAAARNIAFTTLVFGELFRAFGARSTTRIFWEVGVFSNLRLLGVVAVSVLMQLGLHHIPALQRLFGLMPVSVGELALALGLGLIPVSVMEIFKLLRRLYSRP